MKISDINSRETLVSVVDELKYRIKSGIIKDKKDPMIDDFNDLLNKFIFCWGLDKDQHSFAKLPNEEDWIEKTAKGMAEQIIEITNSILEKNIIGDNTMCQNCGKRPGTEKWVGEGSTLDYIHGFYSKWCKICCLEEQLKFHKEAASRIPEIEKELAELLEDDNNSNKNQDS